MPKVSIVLPTYNGEKYLRESIESIINQTFTDWELIIVNDCSTDLTPQIAEEYALKDNRIRVIHNEVNQKLPNSLNIGFRQAKGDFLTWTSDDNYYLDDALNVMVTQLSSTDDAMVCANTDIIDADGNMIVTQTPYDNEDIFFVNCVGACFLYKRCVLRDIGEYDDSLRYVEDYDYWLRIRVKYGKISHINKVLYRYRKHDASLTETKKIEISKVLFKLHEKYSEFIFEKVLSKPSCFYNMYYNCYCVGETSSDFANKIKELLPEFKYIKFGNMNKKVVVFGAGIKGREYCKKNKENIICFVDNDKSKIGESINGVKIFCFDEVKEQLKNEHFHIAVSEEKQYVIMKQLYDAGITNYSANL